MAGNPWLALWTRSLRRSTATVAKATVRNQKKFARAVFPDAAAPKATAGGSWWAGLAVGLAGARRFHLFKPASLALGERPPVVVMLHGCGQDAREFAASAQMNGVAVRERFLVLYPEQDRLSNPQRCWNWFQLRDRRAESEMSLILQSIDQACLFHGGDPRRVAVVGLSAGASMAGLLGSRHSERFRAVVMHSGVGPGAASSNSSALRAMRGHFPVRPTVPVRDRPLPLPPLMIIQGGADRIVSPDNARRSARWWAGDAAVEGNARHVQRGSRYPMTITPFVGKLREEITLVEIPDLGHAWSGGGRKQRFSDPKGPSASRMAWRFLARHMGSAR